MKAYKIKKKKSNFQTFIIGPSIGSFPKPKIPRKIIFSIHKPLLYKPKSIFEFVQLDRSEAVVAMDFAWIVAVEQ